ncbi:MAG: AraC family transcriptional regulator [Bacteroidetes bacterium]|nr:AraC family transcriptional regulator [Bacteroidota bacterium]
MLFHNKVEKKMKLLHTHSLLKDLNLINRSFMLTIPLAGLLNTLILLASVQGIIVCCLLFFSKKNKTQNRILARLIFLIALASFNLYGNIENWFGSSLLQFITQIIPLVIIMPIGPLIYFYVQSVLNPGFEIQKKQKLHFLPVIIDLVPSIIAIVFVIGVLTKTIRNNPAPIGNFIDNYNVYADIPRWFSVTVYVLLSSRYLIAYKAKLNGNLNGKTENFNWLMQVLNMFKIFQVIWFVFLVPYVIPKYTDWMLNTFDWYPLYIPMAVLIYWLGIKGYIISQQKINAEKKANANNPLSPQQIKEVIASLMKAMEQDKIYLNPNLNLAIMSEKTGVAQKIISSVLNQHLQKSFNEFVNEHRVNAFREKIMEPALSHLTIAGIALECGFSSQATFQRTFKEITGKSPSEFRKSISQTA